jgi:hypothetical protein
MKKQNKFLEEAKAYEKLWRESGLCDDLIEEHEDKWIEKLIESCTV